MGEGRLRNSVDGGIGMDTHKQGRVAAALDRLGWQIDCLKADATAPGYCQLLA